jgi:hypothetical protein
MKNLDTLACLEVLIYLLNKIDADGICYYDTASEFITINNINVDRFIIGNYIDFLSSKNILSYTMEADDGYFPGYTIKFSDKANSPFIFIKEYIISAIYIEINNYKETINKLRKENEDLLGFDPYKLGNEIGETRKEINKIAKQAKGNDLLTGIHPKLEELIFYLDNVEKINSKYREIYSYIIKPIEKSGQDGVKSTATWAIISIILSAIISIAITIFFNYINFNIFIDSLTLPVQ